MLRIFRLRRYLRNKRELSVALSTGLMLAYAKRGVLKSVFSDLQALIRLVGAWAKGDYRDSPKKVIFWALAAVLYFISPLDAFPDLLPGGFLDDIAFIGFVVTKIRPDLEKFRRWEKARKS
jgi:uncharacterized membrane protein YkvA (DUF1232 family)